VSLGLGLKLGLATNLDSLECPFRRATWQSISLPNHSSHHGLVLFAALAVSWRFAGLAAEPIAPLQLFGSS
jgi:hypothetical protein